MLQGFGHHRSDRPKPHVDVARLVRAGQGLRTACVGLGDEDVHAGLGRAGEGWMARQTGQLAPGLSANALDHGDLAGTTDFRSVEGEPLVRRGRPPDERPAGGRPGLLTAVPRAGARRPSAATPEADGR